MAVEGKAIIFYRCNLLSLQSLTSLNSLNRLHVLWP